MKTFSGFTSGTAEKLLLGAGAFFKNFTVGTDTYDSAIAGGKLIGATSGGGAFSAVPTIRNIQVDGAMGPQKGLQVIDEWNINLTLNLKEISQDALIMALATGEAADGTTGYKVITASPEITDADYIDNVVWVGRLSGSQTPAIIEISNALAKNGLNFNTQEKNESIVQIVFTAHVEDNDVVPFKIHYPDSSVA